MCAVPKGDFPIRIRWTLNNKSLNSFDGITVMDNKRSSQLTIENVQAHHSGEYRCIAENNAGSDNVAEFLNVNGICCFLLLFSQSLK